MILTAQRLIFAHKQYVAENGGFEAVPETDITEEEKKRKLT